MIDRSQTLQERWFTENTGRDWKMEDIYKSFPSEELYAGAAPRFWRSRKIEDGVAVTTKH